MVLCRTGEIYGFGNGMIGNGDVVGSLSPSPLTHIYGAPVISLSCGEQHSMALTNSGVVWSWGNNGFGQLGYNGGDSFRPQVRNSHLEEDRE